jgi:hypothetical protein
MRLKIFFRLFSKVSTEVELLVETVLADKRVLPIRTRNKTLKISEPPKPKNNKGKLSKPKVKTMPTSSFGYQRI